VDIEESLFLEELVSSVGQVVSDSGDCPEGISPGSEMGFFSQEFERVFLLRERIFACVTFAVNLAGMLINLTHLQLKLLSWRQTLN
jgi:hypothetical protein